MKKAISIVLSVLMILSLAACKPTPKDDIVQGKSLDGMIADATKQQTGGTSSAQGENLADKMGAPKTYTKDLVDAKGKVNIHVNADVLVPDAASVSVERVERASFTQDQVDILTKYLIKGTDLFSGYDYKMTKNEIETRILQVKAALLQNTAAPIKGEGYLESLQEQLITAPDTAVKTPSNGKLATITDETLGSGEELYALAQSENGGYESFDALNATDTVNYVFYTSEKNEFSRSMKSYQSKAEVEALENAGYSTPITSQQIAAMPDIKITEAQAKQKADELISALGINYLTLESEDKVYNGGGGGIDPLQNVWFLRYVRAVNNIPVTYTTYDCMKVEENNQAAAWSYEDITFTIDDSGIVGFSWRSPYKVTGTVTTNSNVLSFSNCMNIFDTMSLAVNAWDGFSSDSPDLTSVDIDVNRIQFGLDRVTEQNKRDSGLLVPVWDFFGTVTNISEVNGQTKKLTMDSIPILTINAIDGSIINRSLGY